MPPDANPEPPSESTGTLRIALNHLPENVAAEVRISGPDEATVLVSESHEFTNLPAGTYTVEASPADTWFVTGDRSLSVEVTQGETATYCLRSVQNESPPRLLYACNGQLKPQHATADAHNESHDNAHHERRPRSEQRREEIGQRTERSS